MDRDERPPGSRSAGLADGAEARPPPSFRLSLGQVLASSLAAASAATVASVFGVAGTVIGTALGSVVGPEGVAVAADSARRHAGVRHRVGRHRRGDNVRCGSRRGPAAALGDSTQTQPEVVDAASPTPTYSTSPSSTGSPTRSVNPTPTGVASPSSTAGRTPTGTGTSPQDTPAPTRTALRTTPSATPQPATPPP